MRLGEVTLSLDGVERFAYRVGEPSSVSRWMGLTGVFARCVEHGSHQVVWLQGLSGRHHAGGCGRGRG